MRDVPQTLTEAKAQGWTWLKVTCVQCKHHHDLRLDDLIVTNKPAALGVLARKLYCSMCRSRSLEVQLGTFIDRAGQPWGEYRPIAFSGDTTVRPPRE